MFEKFKSMDRFTRILLVSCGVLLVLSITLGIVIGVNSKDQDQDPKPVLTTVAATTEKDVTTTTTTTTTVVTTTVEETTTTETEEAAVETEAPVEEVVVVRKTTAAPVENEPDDGPDPEPVKTESPEVTENGYTSDTEYETSHVQFNKDLDENNWKNYGYLEEYHCEGYILYQCCYLLPIPSTMNLDPIFDFEPDTEYEITIIAVSNDSDDDPWCFVKYNDMYGYIQCGFVDSPEWI